MNWKEIGKKILFPPIWVIVVFTIISAVAVPYVLIKGITTHPISFVVYIVSFYAVSVLSIFFALVIPKKNRQIKQKIYEHPLGNRYMTDATFRTRISLYLALFVNLLYALVNGLSYFLYQSMWFLVFAGYYVILAVMRFLLVRYARIKGIGIDRIGELRSAVTCSWILLTVNFVLSGAVLMILYQNKGFEYHGILIYVMALYTFYITTHAIVNLVKYRKYKSPVMTTAKIISLSAALVSMLTLETAMFSQFGQDMAPESQYLMIALTGAGVSITVITMSIYMILRCTKEIKNQGVS